MGDSQKIELLARAAAKSSSFQFQYLHQETKQNNCSSRCSAVYSAMPESNCCKCCDAFDLANCVQTSEMVGLIMRGPGWGPQCAIHVNTILTLPVHVKLSAATHGKLLYVGAFYGKDVL